MSLKIYNRDGRGIWWISGTVNGKAIRQSLGTADKREANELRAALEAKAFKAELYGEEAVRTFDDAALSYIEAGGEKRYLEPVLRYFKGRRLASIKAGEIQAAARKLFPAAKPATWNRQAICPARAVIMHASSLGWCPPLKVKLFEVKRPHRRAVDRAWIEAFMAQADAEGQAELSALVLFMFITGTRLGEAHRVRVEHLNVHKRTVLLAKTKTDENEVRHITPELMMRLANLPARAADQPLLSDSLHGRTTRYRMQAVCKRAGIEYVPPHQAGRHSFATRANELGASIPDIMVAAGWKSPRMVLDYVHASKAGAQIANLFDEEDAKNVQNQDSDTGKKSQVVAFSRSFGK